MTETAEEHRRAAERPRVRVHRGPAAALRDLTSAARAIGAASGIDELLRVTTEAAQSLIGSHQAVTTHLRDGWREASTFVSLSDKYADFRAFDQVPEGLGVLNQVTRENVTLRLTAEGLAQHPEWRGLRDAPGHPPLPSYLAAPLVAWDGRNIGLIQLSDKIDGSDFTEHDEAVLEQLGLLASAALQHLEQAARLDQRVRHARLAAEVGLAFTSTDTLDQKLQRCARAVVDELGGAFARIWTVEGDELVLRASAGMYTHLDGAHARVPVGEYKIGRIARDRTPHLTNSVIGDPEVHDQDWARREGMVAFAGYPLVVGGRCTGVLAVFSRSELPGTALDGLAAVADSVAVGIEQVRNATHLAELLAQEQQARALLDRENQISHTLQEVGRAVTARLDLHDAVQAVTDAATSLTGAGFGAFFYNVVGDDGEAYQLYTLSGAPAEAFDGFGMPRATEVFAPTFRGDGVIRLDDVTADPRYGRNAPHRGMPPGHLPVRSYLAVPVVLSDGDVAGALFFGHPDIGRFGDDAERLAVGIAGYAAIAIENARLYQAAQREAEARRRAYEDRAHVAAVLQSSLLPPSLPAVPGLDVAARYRPSVEDVGGDFYDLFPLRGRDWAVVVGDVCGKGPEAARLTALARHTIRTAAMLQRRPSRVLAVLNQALLRAADEQERFCSAVVGRLRPTSDGARLAIASAGHLPPLVVRRHGAVEAVRPSGTLVGLFDEVPFSEEEVSLQTDDILVLYTDGVVEARSDGQLFGEERLRQVLLSADRSSAERVAERIMAAVEAFDEGGASDDIAVLVVRCAERGEQDRRR